MLRRSAIAAAYSTPIAALGDSLLATEAAPAAAAPSAATARAERRQLTVMFVDLANSTPLALRLDPEAMREVLRAFQDAVTGEIGRLGYVAKLMGRWRSRLFRLPTRA